MTNVEVQTIEAYGIPYTEYRYDPQMEFEQAVDLGDTYYITVVKDQDKSRNRYLVDLFNYMTGKGQRVDLVMQESGFVPMVKEIRKHFGFGWEVFSWHDCHTPF